jgi:hypothetical protein
MKRYGPLPFMIVLTFILGIGIALLISEFGISEDKKEPTTPTPTLSPTGQLTVTFTTAQLNEVIAGAITEKPDITSASLRPSPDNDYFALKFDATVLGQWQDGNAKVYVFARSNRLVLSLSDVTLPGYELPVPDAIKIDASDAVTQTAMPLLNEMLAQEVGNRPFIVTDAAITTNGLVVTVYPEE